MSNHFKDYRKRHRHKARRPVEIETSKTPVERAVRPYPDCPSLACGCIPGYYLCERARDLWMLVNMAHGRMEAGTGTYEEYQAARIQYQEHYDRKA